MESIKIQYIVQILGNLRIFKKICILTLPSPVSDLWLKFKIALKIKNLVYGYKLILN